MPKDLSGREGHGSKNQTLTLSGGLERGTGALRGKGWQSRGSHFEGQRRGGGAQTGGGGGERGGEGGEEKSGGEEKKEEKGEGGGGENEGGRGEGRRERKREGGGGRERGGEKKGRGGDGKKEGGGEEMEKGGEEGRGEKGRGKEPRGEGNVGRGCPKKAGKLQIKVIRLQALLVESLKAYHPHGGASGKGGEESRRAGGRAEEGKKTRGVVERKKSKFGGVWRKKLSKKKFSKLEIGRERKVDRKGGGGGCSSRFEKKNLAPGRGDGGREGRSLIKRSSAKRTDMTDRGLNQIRQSGNRIA